MFRYKMGVKMSLKGFEVVTSAIFCENHNFYVIYDVISQNDVIFRFWKYFHWIPRRIFYGIRYGICAKISIKRVKISKICVFERFPYISLYKCLYNGVFQKHRYLPPFLPPLGPKPRLFWSSGVPCTQLK